MGFEILLNELFIGFVIKSRKDFYCDFCDKYLGKVY